MLQFFSPVEHIREKKRLPEHVKREGKKIYMHHNKQKAGSHVQCKHREGSTCWKVHFFCANTKSVLNVYRNRISSKPHFKAVRILKAHKEKMHKWKKKHKYTEAEVFFDKAFFFLQKKT